ncbi:classical arabinogalactan protein 1-like [Forsythia ovata]|uniref:Classical arabinogalactan protein 1-like n=1 Tax=Forsythia ovata TaxID=205694 RepID=A0ABD1WY38_9LAMI
MAIRIQILSVIFFAFVFSLPVLSPKTPSQSPSSVPPPLLSSPLAPPSPLSPIPYPAPSPATTDSSAPDKSLTLAHAPVVTGDAGHDEANASNMETERDSSSNRMNGRQKVSVAVALVASVCIVGLSALIYKKRKHNMWRSELRVHCMILFHVNFRRVGTGAGGGVELQDEG